ncbi:hypothetical protein D3C85_1463290 [compost metagenome]
MEHGVEQRAEIRFVDLTGHLHGARSEANLVANDLSASLDLQAHPGARNAVPVLDGHPRIAFGKMLDLHSGFFAGVEFAGKLIQEIVG